MAAVKADNRSRANLKTAKKSPLLAAAVTHRAKILVVLAAAALAGLAEVQAAAMA